MKRTLFQHIADDILLRLLLKRARANRAQWPAMAVFAHDYIGAHINVLGRYEREELEALIPFLSQLSKSDVVLDVGANIGNHSVFFREHFDRVICFEPNPRTASLLRLNTQAYEGVDVRPYGLSDMDSVLTATVPHGNAGGARIGDALQRAGQEVKFQVRKFDDTADAKLPISLVKVDVEGHEVAAIEGMRGMLQREWPALLFECHLSTCPQEAQDTIRKIQDVGYDKFAVVVPNSLVPYSLVKFIRHSLKLVEFIVRPVSRNCKITEFDRNISRDYNLVIAVKSGTRFAECLDVCI